MKRIGYTNLSLRKTLPLLLFLMLPMVVLSGCALTIKEYRVRADHNYRQGRYDEAIRDANAVIRQNPTDASSWKILGMSYINKGEFGRAVGALKKATELKTTRTEADKALLDACTGHELFRQGNIAGAAEKFKSAEPFLDRLLDRERGVKTFYAYLYKTYGNVLEKTGKTETALKIYRKASRLGAPATAETIKRIETLVKIQDTIKKARTAEQNRELRKALEHYKTAFAVASRAWFDTREIQEETIKLVLRLDPPPAAPKEVERYVSRGLSAIKMAQSKVDYKNAIAEFQKALALAPWLSTIYYNMGLVQEQAELYEDAIRSFKFYLLAAPQAKDRKEIESKIYELEYKAERAKEVTARDGRFCKYVNGVVKDTNTGLMWAAKDNGDDITWHDAKTYCENYRGGGYTDWRMPTQDELAGLYDKDKSYRCDGGYDVHLTELINITACCSWASETRGSQVALFVFSSGNRFWNFPK